LPEPLGGFYAGLSISEARHQRLYLRLAAERSRELNWRARLRELAAVEADLAVSPDPQFRFHSGEPSAL
jgi:tRNA-(ms[2]io[6]A)-hydroxylase